MAEAVCALERLRESLGPSAADNEDLSVLLGVLGADPVLARVLTVRESLGQLKRHLQRHPSLLPDDFDLCPLTGALRLGSGVLPPGEDELDRQEDHHDNNNNSDSCEPSSDADYGGALEAGGVVRYSPEVRPPRHPHGWILPPGESGT